MNESTMQDVNARLKYLTYLAMQKMEGFLPSEETDHEDSNSKIFGVNKNSEKRPVTQTDINDWCVELKKKLEGNAPNGYIVRIPKYFDGMILTVDGAIKASKFINKTLYIQVDPRKIGDGYIVDCSGEQPEVHRSGKKKGHHV